MKKYLCFDIDNGTFRYGIVSQCLDLMDSGRMTFGMSCKEELFEPLCDVAARYKDQVDGISITMPGVIDRKKGIAYSGGVFRWVHNMDYAKEVKELTGLKTVIANDAKAAAMAEIGYGALKGIRNGMMVMILGGGIGGAVIMDGKLCDGAHYAAGEFSYMRADYQDRYGKNGIFSQTSGVDALAQCVNEATGRDDMNVIRIMMRLQQNDPDVLRGVNTYCDGLASYLYNIQCVIDSSRIVIGGNISEPVFLKLIQEAVHRRFENVPYHNIWEPEVVESDFHSNARMFGAVYNYRQLMENAD